MGRDPTKGGPYSRSPKPVPQPRYVVGLVQKRLRILRRTHPQPQESAFPFLPSPGLRPPSPAPAGEGVGPLPSDGRGRIVLFRSAYPTAVEGARDGSGCSLSRRTGEGQGEGILFELRFLSDICFCTNPKRVNWVQVRRR